jgi:hypothetical protein
MFLDYGLSFRRQRIDKVCQGQNWKLLASPPPRWDNPVMVLCV